MIKVEWFYWLCGFLFLVTAVVRLRDREDNKRFGSAAFWAILAFSFGYGSFVINKTAPTLVEGIAVLLLVCLLYTSPSPRDATLSRMPSSA